MCSHFTVPLPRSLIQVYESRFRFWTKNRDCSDLPFCPSCRGSVCACLTSSISVAELPSSPEIE
jgi:hypothetical protein